MARNITFRFFLFPPEGGLRRLSARLLNDLIHHGERLPQYGGKRVRVANVIVVLADGEPDHIHDVIVSWLEVDELGRVRAGVVRVAGEVVGAMYADAERAEPGTNVVAARAAFARRRLEARWRWTPTSAEIAAIIKAIWPETAGRKVELPPYERGACKRRYPVSYKSERIFRDFHEPVWKLGHLIEDLSEHDLKGILTQIEEEARPAGEGTEHLWRGIGEFVEWTLKLRKARRSPRGIWYATAIQLTPMHDSPNRNVWDSAVLEERRCPNRAAAEAAGREMLKKYADRFAYNSTIEVEVYPEIEWSGASREIGIERPTPAANDEGPSPDTSPT